MAYVITHFFEGGTEEQYNASLAAAHPSDGLPEGQTYHAAGPTEGGWLVVAVWDSKESCDRFIEEKLAPNLGKVEGAFTGPPVERTAEVVNLVTG